MKRATQAVCFFVLASCLVPLWGCGGSASSSAPGTTVLEGTEGRPDVPVPLGPPPKRLVVEDLKKGSGPPAADGDELSVRYFDLAYRGHQIHEDHWRERASPFVLGSGQMVEPWEKGLPGAKAGARRELIVPAAMTFSKHPEIYVLEILSIRPGEHALAMRGVRGTGPRPKIRPPKVSPTHVVVKVLKEGRGPSVRPGEQLAARYIGVNARTGRVQDFWSEKQPYRFTLGKNDLAKAWEIGLRGMRLGGRRELVVPSRLAYGDGTMVYVIELLEMEASTPHQGK